MRFVRNGLFAAALLAAFSLLGVFLLEAAGRVLLRDEVSAIRKPDHRLTPNAPEINRDGIRTERDPDDVRASNVNVIFLGDSFVFGYGMPPENSLPQLLERRARQTFPDQSIDVFNFGWISSSPFLSLRLLRDIGSHYKPSTVILMIDVTDFHDDIKYRKMVDRRGIWGLAGPMPVTLFGLSRIAVNVPALYEVAFGLPADRFFIVNQPIEASRRWLWPLLESVDETARYVREEMGAQFLLVQGVRGFQYSDRESPKNWEDGVYEDLGPFVRVPFEFLQTEMAKRDIPYLSLLPAFEETVEFPVYFEDDPHWNETGNAIAADAVFEFCLIHRCFEGSRRRP